MKRLAIYCVNYNSYEYLSAFLKSVDTAVKGVSGQADVFVYVADNTEDCVEEINEMLQNAELKVFSYRKNLGYFGAVKRMMSETKPKDFDFVIISNVDVELRPDALRVFLCRYGNDAQSVGWVAPQIYSNLEKRDRNPQVVYRYSLTKLRLLRLMFQHHLLCVLYRKTVYKRKRVQSHSAGDVYAGHGSFIILTRQYIEECGIIDFPVFLFCEELYLAEQCRNHGLKVVYDPEIKIIDMEHASTCKMPSRSYFKYNADALKYIIDTFYLQH